MNEIIKKSEIPKIYPQRDPNSYKGQNGRVLIIGGSLDYFGAPILAGLGSLYGGADLTYLLVPECNFETSRSFYPDLIVRQYVGNHINNRTTDQATGLMLKADAMLIGPGITEDPEILRIVARLVEKSPCPVVLDAEAIPAIAQMGLINKHEPELARKITITPHRGEMDELIEGPLPKDPDEEIKIVENFANKWGITILLKSPRDVIASPQCPTRVNETGNAGMTVGGSGDVLAGFVASLIAQHISPYDACKCAAFLFGLTGDNLHQQKGANFIATDLALELPYTIKSVIG